MPSSLAFPFLNNLLSYLWVPHHLNSLSLGLLRARDHLLFQKLQGQVSVLIKVDRMKCVVLGHLYLCRKKKIEPLKPKQTLVQSLPSRHHSPLLLEATDNVGNVIFSILPSSTLSNAELCTLSLPSAKVSTGGLFPSDLVAYLWGKCQGAGYIPEPNCKGLCFFMGSER